MIAFQPRSCNRLILLGTFAVAIPTFAAISGIESPDRATARSISFTDFPITIMTQVTA